MNTRTNYRILIMDDNRAIHEDLQKILYRARGEIDRKEASIFGSTAPAPEQPFFEITSAFQAEESVATLSFRSQ